MVASVPSTYKKSKTPFQYAVNPKSFKRYTLHICDTPEEAYAIEALIVDENFVKRKDTYNATLGGGSAPDTSIEIFQYDFDGNFIKS